MYQRNQQNLKHLSCKDFQALLHLQCHEYIEYRLQLEATTASDEVVVEDEHSNDYLYFVYDSTENAQLLF